jgi:hypothetical protein
LSQAPAYGCLAKAWPSSWRLSKFYSVPLGINNPSKLAGCRIDYLKKIKIQRFTPLEQQSKMLLTKITQANIMNARKFNVEALVLVVIAVGAIAAQASFIVQTFMA